MAEYTREEVMDTTKKLADMLANTEEINRFKEVEAKINQNTKIKKNIDNIKILQKQAVNLQAYGKKEAEKKVNEQIDKLQAEIDDIPIVQEYKEIQVVVNDVLQLVSGTIDREVKNEVIRATGGDLLQGKTGTKVNESS